jgi:hypothetical protein
VALNLFGVTYSEAVEAIPPEPDTELVVVRDLAAICGESEYTVLDPSEELTERYAAIVGDYALRATVLPAPFGVVFRSRQLVERWLELHYVALSGGLGFVDNRLAARVHVTRSDSNDGRDAAGDLSALAAESVRVMRRSAVATVPLRADPLSDKILSTAFLVERELWKELVAEVEDQGVRTPNLRFELTGPWPPYDFVQMQFGA